MSVPNTRIIIIILLLVASAGLARAAGRIGIIDWYGYGDLDLAKLHAALPFHEGETLPSTEARDAARKTFEETVGRPAQFAPICCLKDGDSTLFIGLAEPDAPGVILNPRPRDDVRFPKDVLAIFRRADQDLEEAVRKGVSGEDDSEGYALPKDPAARSDYLRIREWTRAHTATVYRVLQTSRYDEQREHAAVALGYAELSPRQIPALVRASFDSNEGVRDEAIRALEVLCNLGPKVSRQIPAERFLPLLHSLVWTDRNKALFLFMMLTGARDPDLLALLRARALDPLREMAQWKDWSHAASAMTILGRIAGIEEERLQQLVNAGKVVEILQRALTR